MNNTPFFIENEKEVNKQVCKWMFGAAIIIWFMLVLNYLVLRYMARRFRTYIIKQRELIDELIRKDTHMNIAMKNSNDIIFEYDMLNDDYGKLELVVGRLCDITSEKEREERERIARQRDALTGLYSFERVRQIAIELEEQEINRIKYYFGYHTGKAWFEKLFEIALKYAKAQRADDLENNEKVQEKLPFIDFFKIRASVGKVGNDRISGIRFPYLSTVSTGNSSVTWTGSTIGENRMGADNLNWEETTKWDLGIDLKMFNNKVELTADIFKDVNKGIFQQRANIPEEAGFVTNPYTNIGGMKAWGFDGNITFNHDFNKDFGMTMRGNWTFARNEVTYWEQSGVVYPYQSYVGVPYGVQRGLISLGLFKDQEDIEASPVQTFSSDVRPGDIKYKDINGDGRIDADDEVPLSYSNTPTLQYGFAAELRYKKFTASIFFEGVGKVQYFYGGTGYYPFAWESRGNVLNIVADQNNRWTPREYSGDASTENPNARFPRLTYGENKNNNRNSTFWLADGRYLRLKNVELSYRLTNAWLKNKLSLEAATISLVGENLHVWDKVKLWDPEQASSNGAVYPLQRKFTLQVNLTF